MTDDIDQLAERWKRNPDADSTISLCKALRGSVRTTLVQQVGSLAMQKHASNVPVLLAVARMYVVTQRLAEAQSVLVAAGKISPREGNIYRSLGEVLLRRGDADRAEKVFERALQFGLDDAETRMWLDRARVYKGMQSKAGSRAVAAEVARTVPLEAGAVVQTDFDRTIERRPPPAAVRPRQDSFDEETAIRSAAPSAPQGLPPIKPPSMPPLPIVSADDVARPVTASPGQPMFVPADRKFSPTAATHGQAFAPLSPSGSGEISVVGSGEISIVDEPATEVFGGGKFDYVDNTSPTAKAPAPAVPPEAAGIVSQPKMQTAPLPLAPPPPRRFDFDGAPTPEQGTAPAVPHAQDVLDALALAGIYEPTATGGPLAWDRAEKTKRRGTIPLIILTILIVGGSLGTFFYVKNKREKAHVEAEGILAQIDGQLQSSEAARLPEVEDEFRRVFELDSRSARASETWLKERALTGLLKGGADVAFQDALDRAKETGVEEKRVAFAQVASFLFQGDTAGAAALLSKWDQPDAQDAWYQLLAGATLERAGDVRARERYEAAARLDPKLVIAQVAYARSMAIDGDVQKAGELARAFRTANPGRAEGAALVALAWARDPMRPEAIPPEVQEMTNRAADLPLGLKFVPHAVAGVIASDKHDPKAAKDAIEKGLAVVDGPGVATWFGLIAIDTGDEALARKCALSAVAFSALYPPARVLAARVALLGGRLDEAIKATEELEATSPDVAIVRAATAYERLDATALGAALDAVPTEARKLPFLASLTLAQEALAGHATTSGEALATLAGDDAPWSDLVAMDIALDTGDVETAQKIADGWKGTEDRPMRALRLSRLARYEGKNDEADKLSLAALGAGSTTVTARVLAERVFVLVATGKPSEAPPLLAKYPLVLGPLQAWLTALAKASDGKLEDARGKTAQLDPLPAQAPLPARVLVAASLGAMKDRRRGADYVKELLAGGATNPDVIEAAKAFGMKPQAPAPRKPPGKK